MISPVHAPQANALAERVIRTILRGCLDHPIVLCRASPPSCAPGVRRLLPRRPAASVTGSQVTHRPAGAGTTVAVTSRRWNADPRWLTPRLRLGGLRADGVFVLHNSLDGITYQYERKRPDRD